MQITVKEDPQLHDVYVDAINTLLTKNFDESKEGLEKLAVDLGTTKNYPLLVVIIHEFFDTVLVDEYIRKGLWKVDNFKKYTHFARIIDSYIELPESYINNEIVLDENIKDAYFNWYVALRTILDHSIVPYDEDNYLNPEVTSWATDLALDFSKKELLVANGDERILKRIASEDENLVPIYKDLVSFYNKSLQPHNFEDSFYLNMINRFRKACYENDEEMLDKIFDKIVKTQDILALNFLLFEFMKASDPITYRYGKYRAKYLLSLAFDVFTPESKNFKQDQIPWNINEVDYKTYIHLFKIMISEYSRYIKDAQSFDIALLNKYKDLILHTVKDAMKVGEFYSKNIGKTFDNLYLTLVSTFFNPSDDLCNFGTSYALHEQCPLNLIWTQIALYANCSSSDYAEDVIPMMISGMDKVYSTEEINRYYIFSTAAFKEMMKLQIEFFNNMKDIFLEVFGNKANPLKAMGIL